ncbi:MAG: hypothetical protein HZB99_03420 [Candidatus Harrisonbacteria bacterium]|nr:hypothetical protein [Candidatus Harrisonbacteria bacterium]
MKEITELTQVFIQLGFPKHTDKIYQAVKNSGPLLATAIVSKTKVHRPAVYRALRALLDAKLISTKKIGERNYYVPENSQRILKLFTKNLESLAGSIKNQDLSHAETVNSSMRIFHGPKGIRAVFDDVINHSKPRDTFYRYTSERDLAAVNRYLAPDYRERRDKKRLERLVISNPISGKQKRPRLERFIKFIPPEVDLFNQNIIQIIYRDRVAFIDLNTEQAIIIENSALSDFQKVIFKQLYKKL